MTQDLPKGLMNIPSLLGYKRISTFLTIFATIMCFSNLVVISPRLDQALSAERLPPHKAQCTMGTQACPNYTRNQLLDIRNAIKHDTRYSKIPFETIKLVRKYKIKKRPSKLFRPNIKQLKTNTKNLVNIEVKNNDQIITNKIRIATANTRSIKNKSELVMENSKLESIDILAITETWLTDSEEDKAWIKTSGLEDHGYSFHTHNRSDRRGGGLGLWHRKEYQATKIDHIPNYQTLEQAGWVLATKDRTITIVVIYHPPGNTPTRLLDEVSELVQYYFTNHKNLVILGDFNVAVQDLNNPDSLAFKDTMEALGLVQHIDQPTHQLGNTLDHIYTESIDTLGISHAFTSNYISDHRMVGIELNIKNS